MRMIMSQRDEYLLTQGDVKGTRTDDVVCRDREIMDNRRRHERIAMDVPVIVEILIPPRKKNKFAFRATNISAGGLFIHTERYFPRGAPVRVYIILNFDGQSDTNGTGAFLVIAVTGEIIRVEPGGFAIHFNDDRRLATRQEACGFKEAQIVY
jgi:hypothetical protein